ncbi:EF-P 5-aminopentanol modification-associated protein YfmH [Paenibacillus thermoaerophilus]|uniref:EF-P 5-aminopentanol modification-associated protein YfmH n=1 Tax=Paenibacillus thermoaerophilus TaxID=1215385 RepID=A0ABW2V5E1_9BACL|nr:pitrilysin family protein [Paenibacillus thermoaerophilus]TMV13856.1 insulinase family protein [Paenibacillus thermoaerophilus]
MAEVIRYERLQERIWQETLPNGLRVYVLEKPGFTKSYAVFTTKYGSVDNHFRVKGGQEMRVPDGIAHFLEHKMFEEPDGDVFAKFAERGASANAFTSFDRTAYLFSATRDVLDHLDTLVDFVQHPYFTDENVEKEKGIIGQEINMYRDHPDWRSYYGLIEAMYAKHPIHIDIAGTVESISRITKETLYDCYNAFYHPSNMILFVVGGVKADEVLERVRRNQAGKTFPPAPEIERFMPEEPSGIREPRRVIELPVSLPKCLFGFKGDPGVSEGPAAMRRELAMRLVMDALFSPSSDLYQTLYNEGLISDQFGHEFNMGGGYAFSVLGGDSPDPDRMLERFRELLDGALRTGLSEETFERSRRKKIGGFLRLMNSTEGIANEFAKYKFRGMDFFESVQTYEALTLEECNREMREHFDWRRFAVCIVRSKQA